MTDSLSINSSDLILQRNKGKRLHRRTQSTFDLNWTNAPVKETNSEEFTNEMVKIHNILDADITQKILDVAQVPEDDDREVIVDDIDEIPITMGIAPKLNSENNPMSLIKRRNLSTMIPGSGTHCPIRKINLFLELQNIDDLTGLDTIYERKNSVESIDMETLDTLPSNQQIGEQSLERITPSIFADSLKDISKQYSTDAILPPPPSSKQGNSKVGEKKPTHSRQSSADLAMPRSRKESFEIWEKKDSAKLGKPSHSKHTSIDWNNKENSRQENKAVKSPDNFLQRNNSKPTHAKKLSLNIPRNVGKQSTLCLQNVNGTNLNVTNSRPQTSKPVLTKIKPEEKKPKKFTENTKYFATLPHKDCEKRIQEFMQQEEDFVDTRNKFIKELNNINLEKRKNSYYNKATTINNNGTGAGKITRHTRNVTSVIGPAATNNSSKNEYKTSTHGQNLRRQERKRSDSQGRKSLSTSPFRKVSPNLSSYTTSKEASRPESRAGVKGEQMKKIMKADIETTFEPGNQRRGAVTPKVSRGLENSMQKLIEKTDILEEQVSSILQFVSSFKSEEALLRERVKTQEDQIKTLQETLFKYEEEMTNLKANGVCKTEGDCESRGRLKKDASEVRIMTTADTASFESPFTEPSSWYLSCKETKNKGKISPFSTTSSGHTNSGKNDSKKAPDGFLNEYKNFMKKGLLAQPTNKKR